MSASTRPRAAPWWAVYLAVGALLCAVYLWLPPLKGSGPLMNLIGLSPVLAILFGIRRYRPASKLPWLLLAAGSALFWLGDLYTYSYRVLFGADVPFPSPGDALYVAMYPVMMAGLLLLVRRRNAGPDRSGLVDGLILTVGLSLPAWITLMAPYLHQDDLSTVAKIVSVAYPLGDVILVGAAVRLALDAGRREPTFYLLPAASSFCSSPTSPTGSSRCTASTTVSSGSTPGGSARICSGARAASIRRWRASTSRPRAGRSSSPRSGSGSSPARR